MSFAEFLHMGGYAAYVWPAYGLTAAVLIGLEWAGRRELKAAQAQARRRARIAGEKQS